MPPETSFTLTARHFDSRRAGDLKHSPDWLRKELDKATAIALSRSYMAQPVNYMVVSPDGTVRDGNRRLFGIMEDTGPETMVPVIVTLEEITEAMGLEIQLATAENTKGLSDYERYLGYSKLLDITKLYANAVAARLGVSEPTFSRIMSIGRAFPAVLEAVKEGRISRPPSARSSSRTRARPSRKSGLRIRTSGEAKNRQELAAKVKKTRKPSADAVRTQKLKWQVPSGNVITVSGEGLSLEEILEVLAEASKQLKDGIKRNYTAKTFGQAMKDMANN